MKKTLIGLIMILLLCVSAVPALAINANEVSPVVLVVGDTAPASDVITIVNIANELDSIYSITSVQKLASEVDDDDYANHFTVIVDEDDALIVVDDNAPADDVMLASVIKSWLSQWGINAVAKLVSELDAGPQLPNCDVRVNGETIKKVYASDRNDCYSKTSFGSANCDVYKNYFSAGENELEQYFNGNDRVNSDICVVEEEISACTDSDGGRKYNVKGRTIGFDPQSAPGYQNKDYYDKCAKDHPSYVNNAAFENKLFEYSCSNGLFSSETYTCPNGCQNGACVEEETDDSDYNPVIYSISGYDDDYYPKESINLVIKGRKNDGTIATSSEGYNVQYYTYEVGNTNTYLTEYVPSGNYNGQYSNGYWNVNYWAPSEPGNYYTEVILYCSKQSSECWEEISHGPEARQKFYFTVEGEVVEEDDDVEEGVCGELLYIYSSTCPYCEKQEQVIDEIEENFPCLDIDDMEVDIFNPTSWPEIMEEYNVRGVPTMIMEQNGCIKKRSGYTDYDTLKRWIYSNECIKDPIVYEEEVDEVEYDSNKLPNLEITKVTRSNTIRKAYIGDFKTPYLRFQITVKNTGEGAALLSPSSLGTTGIWGKINSKDIGWTPMVDEKNSDKYLMPGKSRTYTWDYADGHQRLNLEKHNELVLYVDRVYDDEHLNYLPNGKVRESHEEDNKITLNFDLDKCTQSLTGNTADNIGVTKLFGIGVVDEYDEERKMVRKYWCASDYSIGFGYRYPSTTQPDTPYPAEEEEGVEIIHYEDYEDEYVVSPIPEGDCTGTGCYVDNTCVSIGIRMLDGEIPKYCDYTGGLKTQREDNKACQNNYECLSNSCGNGKCQDFGERISALEEEMEETQGMLSRLMNWFGKLFGKK